MSLLCSTTKDIRSSTTQTDVDVEKPKPIPQVFIDTACLLSKCRQSLETEFNEPELDTALCPVISRSSQRLNTITEVTEDSSDMLPLTDQRDSYQLPKNFSQTKEVQANVDKEESDIVQTSNEILQTSNENLQTAFEKVVPESLNKDTVITEEPVVKQKTLAVQKLPSINVKPSLEVVQTLVLSISQDGYSRNVVDDDVNIKYIEVESFKELDVIPTRRATSKIDSETMRESMSITPSKMFFCGCLHKPNVESCKCELIENQLVDSKAVKPPNNTSCSCNDVVTSVGMTMDIVNKLVETKGNIAENLSMIKKTLTKELGEASESLLALYKSYQLVGPSTMHEPDPLNEETTQKLIRIDDKIYKSFVNPKGIGVLEEELSEEEKRKRLDLIIPHGFYMCQASQCNLLIDQCQTKEKKKISRIMSEPIAENEAEIRLSQFSNTETELKSTVFDDDMLVDSEVEVVRSKVQSINATNSSESKGQTSNQSEVNITPPPPLPRVEPQKEATFPTNKYIQDKIDDKLNKIKENLKSDESVEVDEISISISYTTEESESVHIPQAFVRKQPEISLDVTMKNLPEEPVKKDEQKKKKWFNRCRKTPDKETDFTKSKSLIETTQSESRRYLKCFKYTNTKRKSEVESLKDNSQESLIQIENLNEEQHAYYEDEQLIDLQSSELGRTFQRALEDIGRPGVVFDSQADEISRQEEQFTKVLTEPITEVGPSSGHVMESFKKKRDDGLFSYNTLLTDLEPRNAGSSKDNKRNDTSIYMQALAFVNNQNFGKITEQSTKPEQKGDTNIVDTLINYRRQKKNPPKLRSRFLSNKSESRDLRLPQENKTGPKDTLELSEGEKVCSCSISSGEFHLCSEVSPFRRKYILNAKREKETVQEHRSGYNKWISYYVRDKPLASMSNSSTSENR